MPDLFGHTRAHIAARHALITPGNHVNSSVPGISGATVAVPSALRPGLTPGRFE